MISKRCIDCKKCRFYKIDPHMNYPPNKYVCTDIHTFCMHPKNAKIINKQAVFISSPSIINRNKDCNWFEPAKTVHTHVWNYDDAINYKDHGDGTYNINPAGGTAGFYIGEKPLKTIINDTVISNNAEIKETVNSLKISVEDHLGNLTQIKEEAQELLNNIDDTLSEYDQVIQENTEIVQQNTEMVNNLKETVDALARGNVQDGRTTIDGGDSQTIFE